MKKKKLFTLASTALCAVLFTSCSTGVSTNFNANWYESTSTNTVVPGTSETLVYDIEMKKESALNKAYSVSYSAGRYTTTLTAEQRKNEEGKDELFYSYQTSLQMSVQFLFGAETSEVFKDTLTSKVLFRSTQNGLLPVYSEKTVHNHTPVGLAPPSLDKCFAEYNFKVVVDYRDKCTSGTAVVTDFMKTSPTEKTNKFSIEKKYSYIDNEELLFAIRGITLTSAQQLLVYNASANEVQPVKISPKAEASDEFTFEIGGVSATRAIAYYPVDIALAVSPPGATLLAYYAKTTSLTNNTYRNVMLRLETPLYYNLGTLVYTLSSATFA